MLRVFAVLDVKSAQFGAPICMLTQGMALRGFSDVCADSGSPYAQHPEDYSLYELGTYDQASGQLVSHEKPKFLYSAAAVIAQMVAARAPKPPAQEVVDGLRVKDNPEDLLVDVEAGKGVTR